MFVSLKTLIFECNNDSLDLIVDQLSPVSDQSVPEF
jgi:hypothetical protein